MYIFTVTTSINWSEAQRKLITLLWTRSDTGTKHNTGGWDQNLLVVQFIRYWATHLLNGCISSEPSTSSNWMRLTMLNNKAFNLRAPGRCQLHIPKPPTHHSLNQRNTKPDTRTWACYEGGEMHAWDFLNPRREGRRIEPPLGVKFVSVISPYGGVLVGRKDWDGNKSAFCQSEPKQMSIEKHRSTAGGVPDLFVRYTGRIDKGIRKWNNGIPQDSPNSRLGRGIQSQCLVNNRFEIG